MIIVNNISIEFSKCLYYFDDFIIEKYNFFVKNVTKQNDLAQNELHRSVTLQDIARYCGVSPSTVSVALRGKDCVLPETREKIMMAARELGYDPAQNAAASRLRMSGPNSGFINQLVALGFPRDYYYSSYFNNLAWGIMDVLLANDFVLVHAPFSIQDDNYIDNTPLPPLFRRGEVDGLITFPDLNFPKLAANLRKTPGFLERPIVSIMHPAATAHSVMADEEYGAYIAVRHLMENGHRHIAQISHPYFQTMPESESFTRRLNGMRKAFEEYGLSIDENLHYLPLPSGWMDPQCLSNGMLPNLIDKNVADVKRVIDFLKNNSQITAVMGINDASVIYLWHLLSDIGIKVPDDISLVGFDDTDAMLDDSGRNILTTVKNPLREIGRKAAQLLIDSLAQKDMEKQIIIMPVELIIRKSVKLMLKTTLNN
jgi:LacI family repressor for deo operon, udp, cdd, tsx, nupC, and nupG